MSPKTRPFSELAEPIDRDPERRARVEEHKQAMLTAMRLAELRRARGLTQVQLAERLGIAQESVSQVERADDTRLSTLTRYVVALGGHLELRAVFDDGDFAGISIGGVHESDSEGQAANREGQASGDVAH